MKKMKSNPRSKEIYEILAMEIPTSVSNEIALKKKILESNEKRLSDILRDIEKDATKADNKVLQDLKVGGKKGTSKDGSGGKDWVNYQGIKLYNGNHTLGQAQIFFDSLAKIRDEITNLEIVEKAFQGLLKSGLHNETICSVYRHNGVPEKFVLSPPVPKTSKLSFKGRFTIK